jgi:GT2 family glycosyltransferase
MKLCVIVPIYDIGPLLADTLLSVLDQKVTVDGAPAEGTLHLVFDGCPLYETNRGLIDDLRLGAEDWEIVVSYGPNAGVSRARNTGIDRLLAQDAPPEFVVFFDADDLMPQGYLQRAIDAFRAGRETTPGLGWVYVDQVGFGKSHYVLRYPNSFDACRFVATNLSQPTSLMHMDVLRAGLRFDSGLEAGLEDYEFWIQAVRAGFVGTHCVDTYCRYRLLSGSRSSVNRANDAYTRSHIMAKHAPFFSATAMLAARHAALPAHLRWNDAAGRFEDVVLTAGPGARVAAQRRDAAELRRGLFERMAFATPTFDEFHAPRVSRMIVIGPAFEALRDDAVLDLQLTLEERLMHHDVVRLVAAHPVTGARQVLGLALKTHWLQGALAYDATRQRTGYARVRHLAETALDGAGPARTEIDIGPLCRTARGGSGALAAQEPGAPEDLGLAVFRALDRLIGPEAMRPPPAPRLRLCAARRAHFDDIFTTIHDTFPVVSAFGAPGSARTGLVLADPEAAPLAQQVLDDPRADGVALLWLGGAERPALRGARDVFTLDPAAMSWTPRRRYIGAPVDPPRDLLKQLRARLLGLERIVVIGDATLYTCLAAAMGADCALAFVPAPQQPGDLAEIEAVVAFQGATRGGVFVPPEARTLYRAMGVPSHLLDARDTEAADFARRRLAPEVQAAS